MINPMELSGKTVLITGASDGIGKATALLLNQLGAKVIMVARNEEKLQSVSEIIGGQNHGWYSYDLRNIDEIEDLVKKIVADHGALDGFVHCAGISSLRPLKMTNFEYLHNMLLVNFYSFVELTRCIAKKGNSNEGMSIIAMSSIAGMKGFKSQTAYSSSKAALEGAIRSMAKELCEKKIRINSIRAGFIKTRMLESFKEKTGKDENDPRFEIYGLGLGEPIDIANAIAYLLSDCSRIITGSSFVIDSGATS